MGGKIICVPPVSEFEGFQMPQTPDHTRLARLL